MARTKKKRNNDSAQKRAKGDEEPRKETWNTTFVFENAAFQAYYRNQQIVEESDWDELNKILLEGLPLGIRINGNMATRSFLQKQIKSLCQGGDENLITPQELRWYPDSLAWQWNSIDRRTVKKAPEFKELKQWFCKREIHGAISRQETVSMIPPLFLDVENHHLVLDLCAAPGSKTCQMIERVHRKETPDAMGLHLSEGAVIANDIEWKRANMLAHQIQRLGSPAVGVVNVDAMFFPKLFDAEAHTPEDAAQGLPPPQILFDRVLCDVPCSGDGTVRKTPHIWSTWNVRGGLSLHSRQLDILRRGLELLQVGGKLVYSTCSLNPMENEAVISATLRKYKNIKLLPPMESESLKSLPAMRTWRVPKPNGEGAEFYESYEDVEVLSRKEYLQKPIEGGNLSRDILPLLEDYYLRIEDGTFTLEAAIIFVKEKLSLECEDKTIAEAFLHALKSKKNGSDDTKAEKIESLGEFLAFMDTIVESLLLSNETKRRSDVESNIIAQLKTMMYSKSKPFRKIVPSMFPPLDGDEKGEAHLLGRRFLPHLMNTGGFFAAVFTKTDSPALILEEDYVKRRRVQSADGSVKEEEEGGKMRTGTEDTKETSEENFDEEMDGGETESKAREDVRTVEMKIDAKRPVQDEVKAKNDDAKMIVQGAEYSTFAEDSEEWKSIQTFYGLHDWAREYLFRCTDSEKSDKKIYCINKGAQRILKAQARMQLRLVTFGTRVLQSMDSKLGLPCAFRISQEGIDALLALGLTKRIIRPKSIEFMRRLLTQREITIEDASANCDGWESILDADGDIHSGSVVIQIADGIFRGLAVHVVISAKMMTLYVDKQEASALADSLGQSDDLRAMLSESAENKNEKKSEDVTEDTGAETKEDEEM